MPAYEPMNAAELMDAVFDVYKKTFVKQLVFSALLGVASFFLMFLIGMVAALAVVMPASDLTDSLMLTMFAVILAVILPLYWIWNATADAGHILLSKQAFYNQPVRIRVRRLPGLAWRALSASLAQLILSVPWLLLVLLVVYGLSFSTGTRLSDPWALLSFFSTSQWIAVSIASVLLYVVYSNCFALAVPAAVFERRCFFAAVVRSWRLIKGEFWKILGIRLLWGALVYLITYSAQGAWALAAALFDTLSAGAPAAVPYLVTTLGALIQSVVMLLIGFVVGPLGGILTALIYFNQRIKREGLDIELALLHLQQPSGQRL